MTTWLYRVVANSCWSRLGRDLQAPRTSEPHPAHRIYPYLLRGMTSMDGRGRWMDNVFIERVWRSLKYERVYLRDFQTGSEAREEIGIWMTYYDEDRPHSALGDRTPAEAYHGRLAA